ncbi:hypothetical protein RclHR1_08510003 [Rhizophagus clarus]|nr:hypothetical protein RclHR1_08510003 [Rhizophagus clarus]
MCSFLHNRRTSENRKIDKFIKSTIYNARNCCSYYNYGRTYNNSDSNDDEDNIDYPIFLEWVPFNRFEDIKQIGEGGFSKVYSALWIDGKAKYDKQDDGSWKKRESEPIRVALKRLNGSQNISVEYLVEIEKQWNYYSTMIRTNALKFYGMTKELETKEFMMIIKFSEKGNLRNLILNYFNDILWEDKIMILSKLSHNLRKLHKLDYCHKNFHSGNIFVKYNKNDRKEYDDDYDDDAIYISDFGLSGPSYKQEANNKVCGVLPYIAPEVLNGEPYTLFSDIYSFGIIMTEISSGRPPFHERKHDIGLSLEICNGLRPEFEEGTPEIYKKLAYKCMNAIPDQRPTVIELFKVLKFWYYSCDNLYYYGEKEKFGYKEKVIRAMFEEAGKKIPSISTPYEKNPDAIYTSRMFTFNSYQNPLIPLLLFHI